MTTLQPSRARAALPVALLAAALAAPGLGGCAGDPARPGTDDPDALTMSNCWPNDDGREWVFAATSRELLTGAFAYLPPGVPVPAMSMDDVQRLLDQPVAGASPRFDYGFRMRFEGTTVTASGVRAQDLREALLYPRAPGFVGGEESFARRLARRVAEVRSGPVRPGALPASTAPSGALLSPLFVHGDAWAKGPAWLGTYGDVDTLLAWKFLDASLRLGHTFEHRLVPSLADDVWLRARVGRVRTITVPGLGTTAEALEVLYLVDYGVSSATDPQGTLVGRYRVFDYGRVLYVPGVGPVRELERRYAFLGRTLAPGLQELELALRSTALHPPPSPAGAGARTSNPGAGVAPRARR